jgi:CubicO group peptidase (beta-lactamase class C family)
VDKEDLRMTSGALSKVRLKRLENTLESYVERGEVPGAAAMVWRRGELYSLTVGNLELNGRERMPLDAIFRLSSLTKPITAAAAMILVEECRLRLDDSLDGWLPELADRRVLKTLNGPIDDTVPAKRAITLRDLLTYRMGFGQIWASADAYPVLKQAASLNILPTLTGMGNAPAPDEWLRRVGTLPLMYQPGERWMYGFASDVLGVLISRAAGQPLEQFLRERLLDPLGMKDTGFSVPAGSLERLTSAYWSSFDSADGCRIDWCKPSTRPITLFDDRRESAWSRSSAFSSGAAGLVSTAPDYLAFGQMLLQQGKHRAIRVLSRPSVETMTMNHLTREQRSTAGFFEGWFENRGWGFGITVTTERDHPARPVGKFGWEGGFGTSWYSDPSEELVGVLLTQRSWTAPSTPPFVRDFWTLVYQAIDD